jgi:hypothetical protein
VVSAVVALALGLAPYAVVRAFWGMFRSGAGFLVAAAGALTLDVAVSLSALDSTSSTAGVAILLEPLASAAGIAVALGVVAGATRPLRRDRAR